MVNRVKNFVPVIIVIVFMILFAMETYKTKEEISGKYDEAVRLMSEKRIESCRTAKEILASIGDYKDSLDNLGKIDEVLKIYESGEALFGSGEYEDAINELKKIKDYEGIEEQLTEIRYKYAETLLRDGEYDKAYQLFKELNDYLDSPQKAQEALLPSMEKKKRQVYEAGEEYYEDGNYEAALKAFDSLGDYEKSEDYASKCKEIIDTYNKAEDYFIQGKYYEALPLYEKLGEYKDSKGKVEQCESEIRPYKLATTISAGLHYSVALRADGEIVCTYTYKPYDFSDWNNIISVAGFGTMIIGLREDGTALVQGRIDVEDDKDGNSLEDIREAHNVNGLQNVVQVVAGQQHVAALKSDGTVVADGLGGLKQTKTEDWKDIVSIAVGWMHTVGVDSSGHVWFTGRDQSEQEKEIKTWTDIVAVSAGGGSDDFPGNGHTVGLKSDGTVVAAGEHKYGQCDVTGVGWTDIVAVSAGDWHTVGLRKNGTVVSTRPLKEIAEAEGIYTAACDVEDWTDIVAISAGCGITLGLKKDGSIVSAGYGDYDQRPGEGVPEWTDIRIYKEWGTLIDESVNEIKSSE